MRKSICSLVFSRSDRITSSLFLLIKRSDCINILSKCLDRSRLRDQRDTSVATICEMIASPDQMTCVSISPFLGASNFERSQSTGQQDDIDDTGVEESESHQDGEPSSLAVLASDLSSSNRSPCHPHPCSPLQICAISVADCTKSQTCQSFRCISGKNGLETLLEPSKHVISAASKCELTRL